YSCKNIPAAYLTGLLFAEKITEKKITELVFDTGLKSPLKKGKIYAFLQGVVESGVNIPYSEGIFPTEERLSGKHISEEMSKKFNEMKGKINKK
ncbi:MAG: 50S ribosomal protein L18, partial [Nanoarchaeota archaeon]|nr:50S ribosomal protein L18 [Nanoarchaeota archaeon]